MGETKERKKDQLYTISEMKRISAENSEVFDGHKATFYNVKGFIFSIPHGEEDNPKPLFYLACPSCKKKVVDDYNAYKCERCDKAFDQAVPTYHFAVVISDFTDSQLLNVFGDAGDAIIGMPASEFFKINEDYSRVDETCRNQYFRDVQFLIRAKTEENHLGES
jgi:Replication factor-A C terminal domain